MTLEVSSKSTLQPSYWIFNLIIESSNFDYVTSREGSYSGWLPWYRIVASGLLPER